MCRYTKATTVRRSSSFPFVFPYDPELFFMRPNRPTLQNVLLRQCNFPNMLCPGDHVAEFWSHEVEYDRWNQALELIQERTPLRSQFLVDDATDESLLAMSQKLVGRDFKATGAIAVRFTTPEGRPIIRLTIVGVYSHARPFYNDNNGPHVVKLANRPHFEEAFERMHRDDPQPDAWKTLVQQHAHKRLQVKPAAIEDVPELELVLA